LPHHFSLADNSARARQITGLRGCFALAGSAQSQIDFFCLQIWYS